MPELKAMSAEVVEIGGEKVLRTYTDTSREQLIAQREPLQRHHDEYVAELAKIDAAIAEIDEKLATLEK